MQLTIDSVNVISEDGVPVKATIMGVLTHPNITGGITYRQHLVGGKLTQYANAPNEAARLAALRSVVQPEAAKRVADLLARPVTTNVVQDEDAVLDLT